MDVVVASCAGACYGVNRALERVRNVSCDGRRVYTLGPLIHNPQVVAELEAQGVRAVSDVSEPEEGSTVVIRSHGVPPRVIDEAHSRGLTVEDATCPFVAKVQQAAADLAADGKYVLVVGEAGHPEVEGICAHAALHAADGTVAVVATADDIPENLPSDVGIVVQTTQSQAALDCVVEALEARGIHPEVRNTICNATRKRQEAARELAKRADCMIVIGGKNSGNTRRLAQICEEHCANVHHIEDASELEDAWFAGCKTVGVTAGASTPASQLESVVESIKAYGRD